MIKEIQPSKEVLIKLGSLVVHIEEYLSEKSSEYDKITIQALLADQDLQDWVSKLDELALVPKKR